MIGISDAVAAPSSITHGGKTYKLSPLRECDWGELERYMQDIVYDSLAHAAERAPDAETVSAELANARRESGLTMIGTARGQQMLNDDERLQCRMIWLSLKQNHPDLLEAEIPEIFDSALRAKINAITEHLNFNSADQGDGATTGKGHSPKKRKKKKRKTNR